MSSAAPPAELTWRGIALGAVLTLLFTAANAYLGLKVGLTFATSIPAAVISMAVLRRMPGATVLENNIVQTVASAAGTLASIIFVLPGLVMIGWWQGFPWLTTAGITATGGILGVMFSVPAAPRARDRFRPALSRGPRRRRGAARSAPVSRGRRGGQRAGPAHPRLERRSPRRLRRAGADPARARHRRALVPRRRRARPASPAICPSHSSASAISSGRRSAPRWPLGLVIGWVRAGPAADRRSSRCRRSELEAWVGAIFRQEVRFFGAGVIGRRGGLDAGPDRRPGAGRRPLGLRRRQGAAAMRRLPGARGARPADRRGDPRGARPAGADRGAAVERAAPARRWKRHAVMLIAGALLLVVVVGLMRGVGDAATWRG